jgi:putative ABC transport system permease protein
MTYVRQKDLGYDKSALLFVRVNGNADVVKGYQAFKNDLTANPLIGGLATANSMLLNGLEMGEALTIDERGKSIPVTTARLQVDTNYLAVYGVKLRAGHNFRAHSSPDRTQQVMLNERAVKRLGWKNDQTAIGKPFTMNGQPGTVVGVVGDFHFNSLQHTIEPLAISLGSDYFSRITIRIDARRASQCLALIKTTWANHFPAALFDYAFVDTELEKQYQTDERFSTIVTYFSILSLVIACLGLYGLIAYTTSQRTKEIGIRKTLGASVNGLVVLLSKDFLKLVVVAGFIAIPLGWYVMDRWLQNFAYRIAIEWWMFVLSLLLVLLIAFLTVSLQSLKAALINPITSLRSD